MKQKPPPHEMLLQRLMQGDTKVIPLLKSISFPGQTEGLRSLIVTAPTIQARVLAADVLATVGGSDDVVYIATLAAETNDLNLARGLSLVLSLHAEKWTPEVLRLVETLAQHTDNVIRHAVASGLAVYTIGGGPGGRETIKKILPLMPHDCVSALQRALDLAS